MVYCLLWYIHTALEWDQDLDRYREWDPLFITVPMPFPIPLPNAKGEALEMWSLANQYPLAARP